MSNVPADLRYTKDHEWIKVAADGTAVIGIFHDREVGEAVATRHVDMAQFRGALA